MLEISKFMDVRGYQGFKPGVSRAEAEAHSSIFIIATPMMQKHDKYGVWYLRTQANLPLYFFFLFFIFIFYF
jgi:hypothetical protein